MKAACSIEMQTYRYSWHAVFAICSRELWTQLGFVLPMILAYPLTHWLFNRDTPYLLLYVQNSWFFAIPAPIYCAWRAYRLRSVRIWFNGEKLIYTRRNFHVGLMGYEVAAKLETPRIVHIISGRPDYTITLHSELDRFSELHAALTQWLPQTVKAVNASPRSGWRQSWIYLFPPPLSFGLHYLFPAHSLLLTWILIAFLIAVFVVHIYRTLRSPLESEPPAPVLPAYLVPSTPFAAIDAPSLRAGHYYVRPPRAIMVSEP
ncbi:MAG: hypothetical protein ABI972_08870 [Acidobacteriota bacterium]